MAIQVQSLAWPAVCSTHLATAVESLLLVGLSVGFPGTLSSVVCCKRGGSGINEAVCISINCVLGI